MKNLFRPRLREKRIIKTDDDNLELDNEFNIKEKKI